MTINEFKKVSVKLLEELEDIADSYKGLKGALESSPDLDEETRRGVTNEIDRLEMKMLFLVDEITKHSRI